MVIKQKYVVIDTDYSSHVFSQLKGAEEFYLEQCNEVLKGNSGLDGNIQLLSVMNEFTNDDVEKFINNALINIKNELPSNVPVEAKN